MALAGVSSGAAEKGPMAQWGLRTNRASSSHSAGLGLRAGLRTKRRDARAVVLRLMPVAVAGGDDGGRSGAGGGAEPCKERVLA
jgi:hypothetical protein